MANYIPQEYWEVLNNQAISLRKMDQELAETLHSGAQLPSLERFSEYHGLLVSIYKVISEISAKCKRVKDLVHHDLKGSFVVAREYCDVSDHKRYKKGITKNIKIVRSCLFELFSAIESMQFWVESSLEDKSLPCPTFSLTAFFEQAKPSLENIFGEATFEIEQELLVEGHEGTLATLLLNIFNNTAYHSYGNKIAAKAYQVGQDIKIEITDNGIGIKSGIAARIFEDGFSSFKGRKGLGLAAARERMEAMGGTIEVEGHGGLENEESRRGAKFTITLRSS